MVYQQIYSIHQKNMVTKNFQKKEFKNSYKIYGVFGNKGGAKRKNWFYR